MKGPIHFVANWFDCDIEGGIAKTNQQIELEVLRRMGQIGMCALALGSVWLGKEVVTSETVVRTESTSFVNNAVSTAMDVAWHSPLLVSFGMSVAGTFEASGLLSKIDQQLANIENADGNNL